MLSVCVRDWQEGPSTIYVKHDWTIFFLVDCDLTFVIKDKLIFHVRAEVIFFYLSMTRKWRVELNVIREPFCFAWWIPGFLMVFKMNCSQTVVLSFDLGFDRTWTLYESIKVINQITNVPWTNNVRYSVIISQD